MPNLVVRVRCGGSYASAVGCSGRASRYVVVVSEKEAGQKVRRLAGSAETAHLTDISQYTVWVIGRRGLIAKKRRLFALRVKVDGRIYSANKIQSSKLLQLTVGWPIDKSRNHTRDPGTARVTLEGTPMRWHRRLEKAVRERP